MAGTPAYMSPEQAGGEKVDSRSDLFSLGSVLYTLCTGRPPFRASTTMAVLKRVCEETPRPLRESNPEIPDWLEALIARLHAKAPADRFQTAAEVAELLGRHLAHLKPPEVVPLRMGLTPGTRLGPYEIVGPLGAGGMGQVWHARDVKLDRPVAIKVLKDASADDPAWLARFDREARLLAALTHPNIAIVYGLDGCEGLRYLVMELDPGQTLARRLIGGALPLDEALQVGRQIAEALEAAHDRGIIHRDLKPANVMLTPEGKVKVLDFGLAKSTQPTDVPAEFVGQNESQTGEGVILGTPAYMAPEQARGRPVDRRCDIWALGCVLFEALTGQRVFSGQTFHDTLATVIENSPDWKSLPAGVPPRVADLLRRCLQKDPQRRLRDAGDVRLELEESLAELAREPSF